MATMRIETREKPCRANRSLAARRMRSRVLMPAVGPAPANGGLLIPPSPLEYPPRLARNGFTLCVPAPTSLVRCHGWQAPCGRAASIIGRGTLQVTQCELTVSQHWLGLTAGQ